MDVIPPETLAHEYAYAPMPAEHIPPIGHNMLKHLFDHPEDANTIPVCFRKVPKKLRQLLIACPIKGVSPGWGIYFIEGLDLLKLSLCGLVGILVSVCFGVIWSVLRDDVQGGFGVACFILTLAASSVSAVQGFLEV